MALAQQLGCLKNLKDAIKEQENLESKYKDYDGGGRYQHLVDQVSKQLGELRLGENTNYFTGRAGVETRSESSFGFIPRLKNKTKVYAGT